MTTGQSGPVITPWTAAMVGENQSPATIARRIGSYCRFTAYLGRDARTASPAEISQWLATFQNPATRSAYFGDIRAMWAWLVLSEQEDVDPTARVRPPRRHKRRPRPVQTRDLMRVVNRKCDDPGYDDVRAMVLLGAYGGLRRAEIARVSGDDFTVSGALRVLGKGDTEDYIALHELIAEEATRRPESDWWFPSHRHPGTHLAPKTAAKYISAAFADVGRRGVTAHQLRHWMATEMLRAGANTRQVQEQMRHRSITSTEPYTEVLRDELAVAVARLPVAL